MSDRVEANPDEHESDEPERAHEPGLHDAKYESENDADERTNGPERLDAKGERRIR
jgi:hypothetical protein